MYKVKSDPIIVKLMNQTNSRKVTIPKVICDELKLQNHEYLAVGINRHGEIVLKKIK